MKKTSKIFGTIALSAALALGAAVPAFAATNTTDPASVDKTDSFNQANPTVPNADAETAVNVFYNAQQIQATVPVEITIVATGDSSTAGSIVAPTNYRIENQSTTNALKVTSITSKENGTEWHLGSMGQSGKLDLTLGTDATATPIDLTAAKTASPTLNAAEWTIPVNDGTDNGELGLTLAGTSLINSAISLTSNTNACDNAFSIIYTVAIA